jgi:septum site-determining protein MinD
MLGVNIENGRVRDSPEVQIKTALRKVVDDFPGVDMLLTSTQSVVLKNIKPDDKEKVQTVLKSHGVKMIEDIDPFTRKSIACPAFPLCGLAMTEAERVQPDINRRLVAQLKETHDIILVDCPAGIEQGFKNAVAGADRAVIVTTPEVSAIRDADRIIGMVEAAELPEPKLIINRFRPAMVQAGDMMNKEDILEILAIPLLGVVPDHEDIIVSANRGVPVVFDEASIVGEAFRRVARRVSGETDVPELQFDQNNGIWGTLMRWMGLGSAQEVAR